jgi:branched-chain amino acid transport system permease protein
MNGTAARVAVPLTAAALLPLAFDPLSGFIGDCVLALGYTVMALGLNVIVGFAGLLDLGYVAFFAIGAYTIGWLGSPFLAGVAGGRGWHVLVGGAAAHLPGIHLNFLLVLVSAVVLTSAAGVVIGVPTLRLRGDYIAVVTLAFGEIIGQLAHNGDQLRIAGQPLTAGPRGVTPIDPPGLPLAGALPLLNLRPWYWLALALAACALVVSSHLRDSRLGRAWAALREDEPVAASLGIPIARTKLLAYGTGAAFGGVAGAFLGAFGNTVNADEFDFAFSILILGMVIVGGPGSIWGVAAGAIGLTFANYWLLPDVVQRLPFGVDTSQFGYGIYGFLLVAVMLLRRSPDPGVARREADPGVRAPRGFDQLLGRFLGAQRQGLRARRVTERDGEGERGVVALRFEDDDRVVAP